MKFIPSLLFLLLLVPLLVVESSLSLNDTSVSNITRGSSLSTSSNRCYWLSPSGNLAFGFYKLTCTTADCSDRYVVGIWFVKSSLKTLVWTANPNDPPLRKPSSILFNNEGKLVLRIDNEEKPLIPEPASYAMMHDDGNFVLYGSDSQIVWKSFDYPTDTILGGQKLKAGTDLISGHHMLSVRKTDGLVVIYNTKDVFTCFRFRGCYRAGMLVEEVVSDGIEGSVSSPVTLNLDSTTGKLYLVGSDGVVLKNIYQGENQQEGSLAYRATLDSLGHFILYKERIDGNISGHEESSSIQVHIWRRPASDSSRWWSDVYIFCIAFAAVLFLLFIGSRQ